MRPSRAEEVEHYVRTGRHEDDFYLAWPGKDFFARAEVGRAALREALVREVRKRTPHATVPDGLADLDVVAFTRAKIAPMVRGLIPRAEQQTVLDVLGHSVVFLTPANNPCPSRTKWTVASTSISYARPSKPGTAGRESWPVAPPVPWRPVAVTSSLPP